MDCITQAHSRGWTFKIHVEVGVTICGRMWGRMRPTTTICVRPLDSLKYFLLLLKIPSDKEWRLPPPDTELHMWEMHMLSNTHMVTLHFTNPSNGSADKYPTRQPFKGSVSGPHILKADVSPHTSPYLLSPSFPLSLLWKYINSEVWDKSGKWEYFPKHNLTSIL